jgi:hypothetical protein
MLADRSEGFRREITGVTTLDEAKEALAMLTRHGVAGDAEIHSYLHVGWTGNGPSDPNGRNTSLALWAKADQELIPGDD